MKKLLAIILTLVMLFSIVPIGTMTVSAASYPSDYRKWSQGASDNSKMRSNGCWVVAQSKLIYETGVNQSSTFNPDAYLLWQQNNGYINSRFNQTNGGYAPVAYAKSLGKNLSYLGCTTTSVKNKIWDNIEKGYYTLLFVTKSGVPSHYIMIANDLSKQNGELYCYNSWVGYSSVSPMSISSTGYTIGEVYTYSRSNTEPHTLTLTYNANGGYIKSEKADKYYLNSNKIVFKKSNNSKYTQSWKYGASYSDGFVDDTTLGIVKDGYTFEGWSLSSSGGTVYDKITARKPEDIYPNIKNGNATITMYAVWKPNKLTVTYNANGGYINTGKSDTYYLGSNNDIFNTDNKSKYSQSWKYGTSYSNGFVDDTTFGVVKDGYRFKGWSLSKSDGSVYDKITARKPEDIYPNIKNGSTTITMYAVWEKIKEYRYYDWTFDFDKTMKLTSDLMFEDDVSTSELIKEMNRGFIELKAVDENGNIQPPQAPEKPGYKFIGWKTLLEPGESVYDVTHVYGYIQAQYEALSCANGEIDHTYETTTAKATLSKNGSIVKKCTVCDKVESKSTIKYVKSIKLSTTTYTYNGKVKTPSVTVKDSAGKTLKKDTDYTVTYDTGRKNVGTYDVKIKMKGNYTGTKTLTFKINPPKTSVSKLTPGKKTIKAYVGKKTSQVTGYQIQYSAFKNFKSAKTKTLTSYKSTSATLKLNYSRKTYYVRVRTYKTVNGVKYYSGWSTYKTAKTK